MSKMTARVPTLAQAIEGRQRAEGLERGGTVWRLRPWRGLRGLHGAPHDHLSVARPHQLVGELGERLGREIGEGRRRLLVVLVLEPGEVLDAAKNRRELRR